MHICMSIYFYFLHSEVGSSTYVYTDDVRVQRRAAVVPILLAFDEVEAAAEDE